MATSQILQRLYSLNTSSPHFCRNLYDLIRQSEGEDHHLLDLQGSDLIQLVDFLDRALAIIPPADDVSRLCLHKLQAICSHNRIVPSSYIISGDIARVGRFPVASTDLSEVWEAQTFDGDTVCIKYPRITRANQQDMEKAFYKEATMWKWLRHQNIVPFVGVMKNPLQFVSEWMPKGTLTEYLRDNPGVNRVDLILDVAEGLNYLHSKRVTHGDLKGPNILIDHDGRARLTDFGFSSVVRGLNSILVSNVRGFTPVWAAPEVIRGNCVNTSEADVYAFGLVVIEVFTASRPLSDLAPPEATRRMFEFREMPGRPQRQDLTDPVWDMTVRCWQHEPNLRPKMTEVVATLRECRRSFISAAQLSTGWEPPTPRGLPISDNDQRQASPEVRTPLHGNRRLSFEDACRRIDEVAEELAAGRHESRDEGIIELLELCGRWCIVPTSYKLKRVKKEGTIAQSLSPTTKVWTGEYARGKVALNLVRVNQDNPLLRTESEFYKEAVLIKEYKHDHISPFYGVFKDGSDFYMVFPWYKNGNIMDYLEKHPNVDRYSLLLGAMRGLQFLHENSIVHGALRPSRVLIDDSGQARLSIGVHDSIMALPLSILARYFPPTLKRPSSYPRGCRYLPPEIQSPDAYGMDEIPAARDCDIYGMAMIIYEVLARVEPYHDYDGFAVIEKVRAEEIPKRHFGRIPDPIWSILQECWYKAPARRPPSVELYDALSKYCPPPLRVAGNPQEGAVEGLPRESILIPCRIQVSSQGRLMRGSTLYLRLKYGRWKVVKSSPVRYEFMSGQAVWQTSQEWWIDPSDGDHAQSVFFEVFIKRVRAREDTLWATGNFSLFDCKINKKLEVRLEGRGGVDCGHLSIVLSTNFRRQGD